MNSKFSFWFRWLVGAAALVLVFGLFLVLLPGQTQRLFNFLFFSSQDGSSLFNVAAVNYIKFVCGVLGAVMIGWSVALMFVLSGPFRRRQREGWNMVTVSLIAWFVPDTAVSLLFGFWQNALSNLVLAIMFAIPLVATRESFISASA